jgi:NAD(P) transhydrogenase subunit beta
MPSGGVSVIVRDWPQIVVDLIIILLLIAGIAQFRAPGRARAGNFTAALAMLCALGVVFWQNSILEPGVVVAGLALGTVAACLMSARLRMIHMPSMVALQNGLGGLAACIVSFVEMERAAGELAAVNRAGGVLGLVVGAVTFSGSMIAAGKLSGFLRPTPVVLPGYGVQMMGLCLATVTLGVLAGYPAAPSSWLLLLAVAPALLLGCVFSARIGGADMPVLISFLNAGTGLAAAFCGVVIQNRFLIACGAMVGASGVVLTQAMCQAMNRSIGRVLLGGDFGTAVGTPGRLETADAEPGKSDGEAPKIDNRSPFDKALEVARNAGKIIVVPGYGMALAQAQFEVVKLANRLEELGKEVNFAIHPVAGRMPGHMNVLLAEAEVDYDRLRQLDEINASFKDTDLVLVVGACDVVNPAAIHVEGTPISGMPILLAHEAKSVVVCNLNDRPGYSGVANSLYRDPKVILLWGDAKASVSRLLDALL